MLGYRSSGFGAGMAPYGFAVHFDPMGVVNEAIEDGIGVGPVSDQFMPSGDGELTGKEGRAAAISILQDFQLWIGVQKEPR